MKEFAKIHNRVAIITNFFIMKSKSILGRMTLVSLMAFSLTLTSCDKEEIIPSASLPPEINTFIGTHFPASTVIQVIKDRDGFTKSYDVTLSGSISLEFNRKKEIVDIDGISQLPDSVIPDKIRAFVASNYPGNVITDWELDDKNQQVELDNGLDLAFNMSGEFLRIDN